MKKLLIFIMALMVLAAFSAATAATTVKGAKSNGSSYRAGGCCCTMWDSKDPEHCIQTTCPCPPGGGAAKSIIQNIKGRTVKSVDGAGVVTVVIGGKEQPIGAGGQSVIVCSGGYWWTITWGGMTQGGPCSQEGAIK